MQILVEITSFIMNTTKLKELKDMRDLLNMRIKDLEVKHHDMHDYNPSN